jgi:hypothetical protein
MSIISLDAPTLKVTTSDGTVRAPQEITDGEKVYEAPFTLEQ